MQCLLLGNILLMLWGNLTDSTFMNDGIFTDDDSDKLTINFNLPLPAINSQGSSPLTVEFNKVYFLNKSNDSVRNELLVDSGIKLKNLEKNSEMILKEQKTKNEELSSKMSSLKKELSVVSSLT